MRADLDARANADARFGAEIAAEAASEFTRAPSYDELWSNARRAPPSSEPPAAPVRRPPVLAAVVLVLVGGMALIGLRERVARLMPATAPAYAAVGLPVNLAGLELRGVRSKILLDGARRVLAIEGEIVNLRREANRLPPVALTVRGENGQAKYAWTAPAPKARLEAGETIAFRARLASPPADGADVLVRFAGLEEATKAKAPPAKR
jgi:hypothetical protein